MKNRKLNVLLTLILCLTLLISAFPSYGEASSSYPAVKYDLGFVKYIIDYVKANYPFEVEDEELVTNAVKGILQNLDPYSDYYTKEEVEQLLKSVHGNYVGIGIYIGEKDGYIQVLSIMENSPSEAAGLKAGDLIISIDDKSVEGFTVDEAASLIQGKEGTKVKLGILRGGQQNPIYITVTRKLIEVNPVKHTVLEDNIGYISLSQFNDYSYKYIKNALNEFDKKGITKVILDLRDNPGGLLDQAISIARLFIPKGPIVYIREKNKSIYGYYSYLNKLKYKLAVLVNENSASASEILAGAVKDRKAGTLIGTKTYGKGLVQTMMPLPDGSIIKMTTAEYLTPNKTSIHGIGIEPDVVIENTNGQDLQLQKAIEILK